MSKTAEGGIRTREVGSLSQKQQPLSHTSLTTDRVSVAVSRVRFGKKGFRPQSRLGCLRRMQVRFWVLGSRIRFGKKGFRPQSGLGCLRRMEVRFWV